MLSIVLSYASGLLYKEWEVNITGTFLLAGITSQAGKEFLIEYHIILKAQQGILNHHPRREGWVISGNRAYARTLTTLQAVISLGLLNDFL
jgi:hypothetical protein